MRVTRVRHATGFACISLMPRLVSRGGAAWLHPPRRRKARATDVNVAGDKKCFGHASRQLSKLIRSVAASVYFGACCGVRTQGHSVLPQNVQGAHDACDQQRQHDAVAENDVGYKEDSGACWGAAVGHCSSSSA